MSSQSARDIVSENLQNQYDEYYGSADLEEWRRLGALDKADRIQALCTDHPHEKILDIGCGDGAVLKQLDERKFGASFYGIEISRSGIAATKAKKIARLTEVMLFDGYDIPYSDQSFDLATLTHVVEHVGYPRRLLAEAGRVARFVFVEVPLEHTLRLKKDYEPGPVGHINFYTDTTIRRLLQTCGFEVVTQVLAGDSKSLLTFQHGRQGTARYAIRQVGLQLFPSIAKYIFVYNCALLCRSPEQKST